MALSDQIRDFFEATLRDTEIGLPDFDGDIAHMLKHANVDFLDDEFMSNNKKFRRATEADFYTDMVAYGSTLDAAPVSGSSVALSTKADHDDHIPWGGDYSSLEPIDNEWCIKMANNLKGYAQGNASPVNTDNDHLSAGTSSDILESIEVDDVDDTWASAPLATRVSFAEYFGLDDGEVTKTFVSTTEYVFSHPLIVLF